MVSNRVQASAQESCERSDTKDLSYLPSPKQAQATEGVLPLSGGAGPAVVLSHPGRGSALTWPYQQPVLSAAGFRVIAYSRRGYYGSPAGSAADTGNYAETLMR